MTESSHQTHASDEEQRGGSKAAQEMEEKVEEVEVEVVEVEPRGR